MSDHFVRVIPLDPKFVPDRGAELAAISLAEALGFPGGTCMKHDEVTFIDGGENFPSRLPCRHCGNDLLSENNWTAVVTSAFKQTPQFSNLDFQCPRCDGALSLYDISLHEPSHGFARWVLELPATGQVLRADETLRLSSTIGCVVRVIYVHI